MTTGAQLIQKSLYIANVLDPQEEVPAFYLTDGLDMLNSIIDQWGNMNVYIPYYDHVTQALTAGTYQYTITTPLEVFMEGNVIDTNNVQFVVRAANLQQHNTFNYGVSSGIPRYVFLQNLDNSLPNQTILFVFPTPFVNYTLNMYVKKRLQEVDQSTPIIGLPSFFFKALKFQLARDFSIEYSTVLSPRFDEEYDKLMTELKAISLRDMSVINDNPYLTQRRFNPWGTYVG